MTKDTIEGALARGYCSKRNENKILDPDLIMDMKEEICKFIDEAPIEEELCNIICRDLIMDDEFCFVCGHPTKDSSQKELVKYIAKAIRKLFKGESND